MLITEREDGLVEMACGHLAHPDHTKLCKVHGVMECLSCAYKHQGGNGRG